MIDLHTIDEATRERLLASGRMAAETVMVALLAVQAARLAWLLIVAPTPLGDAPPLPSAGGPARTAFVDAFHPGGSSAVVDGDGDEALGYRLLGLRAPLANGVPASAILVGPDKQQRAYRAGDALADGIVLAVVSDDHAVLRSRGIGHRLSLGRPGDSPRPPAPASLPTAGGAAPVAAATPDGTSDPAMAFAPAELMAHAGLRAHLDGGYTLVPRGDDGLFQRAGLEAGDVLTAVDGRPLDLERLRGLEQELQDRPEAVLTIRRGNQTRTITLQAPTP